MINDRNGREDVDDGVIPKPVTVKPYPCPVCRIGQVTGVVLFPISLSDLNKAVELRKRDNRTDANSSSFSAMQQGKRPADDSEAEAAHDVSYLLLSHSRPTASNSTSNEPDHHRTGRWTNDEIAFVDFLVDAFDKGNLPIPHGAKLNEFLGDMLLCKSSRLTKKMKNAKLSTRSYTLKGKGTGEADCRTLSELESRFLASVTDEPTKLELRFNMTKLWRMHFSNLCLQIGYAFLDARDWVAGLEEMERLASSAEESLRKARRRRIGLALQPERASEAPLPAANNNPMAVFSSFNPPAPQQNGFRLPDDSQVTFSKVDDLAGEAACEDDDFLASMMNIAKSPNLEGIASNRSRFFSVDFGLDDSVDPLSMEPSMDTQYAPHHNLGDCGPFLEEIVSFMQAENMPFQHVDVWVPSFVNADGKSANSKSNNGGEPGQELRLFHAGHATRSDLDQALSIQLNEFGQYSTNFTFAPSVGLPGRVYSSGKYAWERNIHDLDSRIFLRSGGAKVYGIKTGFGLPLESALVGRMVIAMYSTLDMEENATLIEKCRTNFAKYTPEPKWKLVIDMASTSTKAGVASAQPNPQSTRLPLIIPTSSSTSSLVHYSHDNNAAPAPSSVQQPRSGSFDHFSHDTVASVATFSVSNVQRQHQSTSSVAAYMTRPERSMSTTSSISQTAANDNMSLCPTTPRPSSATNVPMEVSCTSTTSAVSTRDIEDEEQRIATLLGDHMPLSEIPLPGENQNGLTHVAQLLPHFMSLRLLLLRSANRRTTDENDMIDVIKKSFRCYSKDNKRTGAELAALLAKDWMYLHSSMPATSEKKPPQDQYQTHKMAAPTYGSVSANAGPMPSPFFPITGNQSSPPNLTSHRMVSVPSLSLDQYNGQQSDNNSADGRNRSRSVSASSENTYADVVPEN